jgi:BAAT / Acyl-CoA thioester hydrolase C terminal
MGQLVRNAWRIGRDRAAHRPTLLRLRAAYAAGLAHGTAGTLAAERVDRPLLLLTGTDDAVWPGEPMAEAILGRRAADVGRDRHVRFSGAGHLVRLGAFPTDAQWTGGIALGGEREGQAVAQRAAITEVTRFLADVTALVPDRAVVR